MRKDKITIYCDGACSGNGRQGSRGGWGAVLKYKDRTKHIRGAAPNTTNQQMEITACIKALEQIRLRHIDVEIFSDSAYLVNCMRQGWYRRWRRNGWTNSRREPVANKDLWIRLLELLDTFQAQVSFRKVKGHAGIALNEIADKLARQAIEESGAGHGN